MEITELVPIQLSVSEISAKQQPKRKTKMTVDFGNKEGSAPAPVVEETKAAQPVAQNPTREVPVSVPATTGNFRLGDRLPGFKDVLLPKLNIVQNIGELKDSFQPGSLVFNRDTVLFTPPIIDAKAGTITKASLPPVVIYVVGIVSERFSEKVVGGMGGQIVDTEAEVRAAGGTLDYKEWDLKKAEGMLRFEPLIDLLIAIEKPAHIDDGGAVFGFPVVTSAGDIKHFAIGIWSAKGTAYTHAVKKVFNFHRLAGLLRDGYYTYSFNLTTRSEKFKNGNSAWVPVCLPKVKTSAEVIEFIRGIVGA